MLFEGQPSRFFSVIFLCDYLQCGRSQSVPHDNFFHNLLTAENTTGMFNEELQQLEFHGSQFQILAVKSRPVGVFIKNKPLCLNGLPISDSPQDGLNPSNDFTRTEGLQM